MTTTIRARIYTRGEVSFVKFLFFQSWFAKLLEINFSYFAKTRWMQLRFTLGGALNWIFEGVGPLTLTFTWNSYAHGWLWL
jgi:hypothetical protein